MNQTQRTKNKIELTTRGRHAIAAMIVLAKKDDKSPLSLSQISETGHISLSYLEQLIACLRRHKLVKSYRGPGGGYILAKAAEDITVAAILIAAETFTQGKKQKRKTDATYPGTKNLWDQCSNLLYGYLNNVSLADVIHDQLPSKCV